MLHPHSLALQLQRLGSHPGVDARSVRRDHCRTGCHADDAKHFAYAEETPWVDPKRQAVPVGTTCRFCERTDCNMRSAPSYKFAFRVDEQIKKDNFFSPLVASDERTAHRSAAALARRQYHPVYVYIPRSAEDRSSLHAHAPETKEPASGRDS